MNAAPIPTIPIALQRTRFERRFRLLIPERSSESRRVKAGRCVGLTLGARAEDACGAAGLLAAGFFGAVVVLRAAGTACGAGAACAGLVCTVALALGAGRAGLAGLTLFLANGAFAATGALRAAGFFWIAFWAMVFLKVPPGIGALYTLCKEGWRAVSRRGRRGL